MAAVSHCINIAEVSRSISECNSFSDIRTNILMPMMRSLGSPYGAVFLFNRTGSEVTSIERMATLGSMDRCAELYRSGQFRMDPLRNYAVNTPARLSDLLRDGSVAFDSRLKEYIDNCLLGNDIGPCMGFRFCLPGPMGTKEIEITFPRRSSDNDFSDQELALLGELQPILRLSLTNTILGERLNLFDRSVQSLSAALRVDLRIHGDYDTIIYNSGQKEEGFLRAIPTRDDAEDETEEDCCASIFTKREWEVIDALERGHSNESLSSTLGISVRTAENHLRAIYRKACVNSRTQLLAKVQASRTRSLEIDLRPH